MLGGFATRLPCGPEKAPGCPCPGLNPGSPGVGVPALPAMFGPWAMFFCIGCIGCRYCICCIIILCACDAIPGAMEFPIGGAPICNPTAGFPPMPAGPCGWKLCIGLPIGPGRIIAPLGIG